MLALAGCNVTPPAANVHQPMTVRPEPHQHAIVKQRIDLSARVRRAMNLNEDRRARFVGDTIIIGIEEKTSASKKSNSNVARNGSSAFTVPIVAGVPLKTLRG